MLAVLFIFFKLNLNVAQELISSECSLTIGENQSFSPSVHNTNPWRKKIITNGFNKTGIENAFNENHFSSSVKPTLRLSATSGTTMY